MTLANQITILRIIFIPVFVVLLVQDMHLAAAIIFTITILTDALDGFVARKRKQTTKLGSFLDPLADKILIFSSLITLAYLHLIPVWVFVVIVSRDCLIVLGWVVVYFIKGTTDVKPRFLGKMTTIVQMGTLWVIVLGVPYELVYALLIITVAFTVVSCLDYIYTGTKELG